MQQYKMHIKETPFLSVLLKKLMLLELSKISAKRKRFRISVKKLKEKVRFFAEYATQVNKQSNLLFADNKRFLQLSANSLNSWRKMSPRNWWKFLNL